MGVPPFFHQIIFLPTGGHFCLPDWRFFDLSYKTIESIADLDPRDPIYLSLVIAKFNQSAEYIKVFLDQNKNLLVSQGTLDWFEKTVRDRHLGALSQLPFSVRLKLRDILDGLSVQDALWTVQRQLYRSLAFLGIPQELRDMIFSRFLLIDSLTAFIGNRELLFGPPQPDGLLPLLDEYLEEEKVNIEKDAIQKLGWRGFIYPIAGALLFTAGFGVKLLLSSSVGGIEIVQ